MDNVVDITITALALILICKKSNTTSHLCGTATGVDTRWHITDILAASCVESLTDISGNVSLRCEQGRTQGGRNWFRHRT